MSLTIGIVCFVVGLVVGDRRGFKNGKTFEKAKRWREEIEGRVNSGKCRFNLNGKDKL